MILLFGVLGVFGFLGVDVVRLGSLFFESESRVCVFCSKEELRCGVEIVLALPPFP